MKIKKVTLNINESVYNQFKTYCKKNGLITSKMVEKLMLLKVKGENNG